MDGIEDYSSEFGVVEYVVFGVVLALSAAIGIFHGCVGSKQKSTEEFLMANRQMSALPVALSLVCSFVSAITLLGNPTEIYLYGTQYGLIFFSFIPLTFSLIYLYVPVFFNLQISSAYEYLEMRFNKGTRIFVSILAIVHLTIYMAIVVLGPSLALEQVTGIDTKVSTAAIFVVCIFYSSIGGLKAVLWTDALQAVIMLGSLTVVVIKGFMDVGDIHVVWEKAVNSSRVEFFNVDPDPRTRHTFWTAIVGGYFMWLPMYGATQAQIQRYLSLPSIRSCNRALVINMVGLMFVTVLTFLAGIVLYAKYNDCDPLQLKVVTSSDQLLPLFVMETSGNVQGLPGLFVAGLTCASLSTVSSGLSALALILTYDYIRILFPEVKDERLSLLSKVVTLVFGLLSFGFVFVVEKMGNILPATSSLVGTIVGPTLGIFILGMFFPWVNAKGALTGMVTAFGLMISLAVGSFIANDEKLLPNQRLPLSTDGCPFSPNNTMSTTESPAFSPFASRPDWKDNGDSILIQILSVSYIWQPGMGTILTVIVGLVGSFIFSWFENPEKRRLIPSDVLSPPIYRLWMKLWPSMTKKFVDTGDDLILVNYLTSTIGSRTGSEYNSNSLQFKREPLCDLKIKPL